MINVPQDYILIQNGPAAIAVKKEYKDSLLKLGIADPDLLINKCITPETASKGRTCRSRSTSQGLPLRATR